ncbi:hypothetical protein C8R44DRAFT_987793 [Mycena epipterygia]|nr:hypothetical protein C8R44DRAFT_987793 [Mycena epipterygia]
MEHSYAADSLALIPTTHLPVFLRSPGVLAPVSFIGPGKTLHEIYSTLGDRAEKHANRAAHSLGLGPAAVAERIRIFFGDGSDRESALSQVQDGIPGKLEKACRRLMKYALPAESIGTQLEAFKSLVALTTRYPGLRRIFLKNTGAQADDVAVLWDRPGYVCGLHWQFHRDFAAACMTDLDISSMVEDIPIQSLGSILDQCAGLSIIERLLVASDCEGSLAFSRFIAIRYLVGILDLPSFWLQSGMMHRAVVQKFLARATLLLKDLGVDSEPSDESSPGVASDIEGVDILCEVLLARIQTRLPDGSSSANNGETWYPSLYHVVQLLRQPKTEDLLPRSWTLATAEKLRDLVPSQYETRVVDTIYATGQLSDDIHPLYHAGRRTSPQTDTWYLRKGTKRMRFRRGLTIRRATNKDRVLQYRTAACSLLKDIGNASNQPYLQAVASLSLLIFEMVQRVKDNEKACVKMAEQSYELVCALINICRDSEAELASAMVRSITQFSETLEKILTFVRSQVKGGFWWRVFRSMEDADLIAECNAGLKHALDVFGVQSGIIAAMTMAEMQGSRKRARTSDWNDSSDLRAFPMLPASPKIFYGRDDEVTHIVNTIIESNPARIAICGAEGVGKTAVALAIIHNPPISKMFGVHRYFIECNGARSASQVATAIASQVATAIATHMGLESTEKRAVIRYLSAIATEETPVLLVLDDLDRAWKPHESRSAVEDFLSLLADLPHVILVITIRGDERPRQVRWTRPFLGTLSPLSISAARMAFLDISDVPPQDPGLEELLALTKNNPGTITHMAGLASFEGCASLIARWHAEGPALLLDRAQRTAPPRPILLKDLDSEEDMPGLATVLDPIDFLEDPDSEEDMPGIATVLDSI